MPRGGKNALSHTHSHTYIHILGVSSLVERQRVVDVEYAALTVCQSFPVLRGQTAEHCLPHTLDCGGGLWVAVLGGFALVRIRARLSYIMVRMTSN